MEVNAVKEPGLLDVEEDQILSPEDESSCQKYLIFVIDNLRLGSQRKVCGGNSQQSFPPPIFR